MPSYKYAKRITKPGSNIKSSVELARENEGSQEILEMMADAGYLRQSSALINDALQKGFDVLQLADGDIVLTGTKTVVYRYTWDQEKTKLIRTKSETSGAKNPRRSLTEEDEDESEEA